MRNEQCALLLMFPLLFSAGCRKDADGTAPSVQILQPAAGSSVYIPDTLAVRVAVQDDHNVESLSVLITDQDGVPVSASVAATVNASSATVELELPLISERVESGPYVLTAIAADGTNEGRGFQAIVIHAAPLRLRAIYAAEPSGPGGPMAISKIDSLDVVSPFLTVNELAGAAIDPDRLHTAGTQFDPLVSRDLNSLASSTLVPNPGTPSALAPYFTSLLIDPADEHLYCGTRDGFIRGFASSGTQTFTALAGAGWYSECTAVVGDRLVSAEFNLVQQQHQFTTYGLSSGAQFASFPLGATATSMFATDEQHVLLFGEQSGDGVIQLVNVSQGGVLALRSFAGDPVRSVAQAGPGIYLVASVSGLRRYLSQSNSVTSLVAGEEFTDLAFDPVSGGVWAATGTQIRLIDPLTGATAAQHELGHPVGHVLLQHNR